MNNSSQYGPVVLKILKQYKSYPLHILDLNVSKNSLLSNFVEKSTVRGVTQDKDSITSLKEVFPNGKFYGQNRSSFRVPSSMNCIVGFGGLLNTLGSEKKREAFLKRAYDHIAPYGLFIVDVKTSSWFEKASSESLASTVEDSKVVLESRKRKKTSYHHAITTFNKEESGLYSRSDKADIYSALTVTQMKKLANSLFDSVTFLDLKGRKAKAGSQEYLMVCQKGRE